MTISNANIITCPYCGVKKELMSLNSSNNIGAQYWSDLKTIAPMDPKISPVQKCPNCGKYYLEYKQEPIKGDKESWETGELSYWEWKEAYMQFCTELGNSISPKDMLNVQGWLLQAYNDYFYRGKVISTPSVEEQEFIANIIKELIETIDWGETMDALFPGGVSFDPPEREKQMWSSRLNPIIKAELYREIGDFQKCADLIKSFNGKSMHSFDAGLCFTIKEQMKNGEIAVFKFYDGQEEMSETHIRCSHCGWLNPIENQRCEKCGTTLQNVQADLHSSDNPQSNAHQKGSRFKSCPNGHYYSANLDSCPYCGPVRCKKHITPNKRMHDSIVAKLREWANSWLGVKFVSSSIKSASHEIQCEEIWNPLNNTTWPIIYIDGHGYKIFNHDRTASFACWSEETKDEYIRFWLWRSDFDALDGEDDFTKRIKSISSFEIPREIEYNGKLYPVTCIDNGAFAFCEIDTITIPDTIVRIGRQAFFRCDGLKNLVIPDSVKDLPKEAISECKDLKTITWQGVTYEDDIDELFLFPDNKEKYAVEENYKNHIDPECAERLPYNITVSSEHEIYDKSKKNSKVKKSIMIGRHPDNDVVIHDPCINKHCIRITQFEDGHFTLLDLQSAIGCYVNGSKVFGEIELHLRDVVRIGNTILPWLTYFYK